MILAANEDTLGRMTQAAVFLIETIAMKRDEVDSFRDFDEMISLQINALEELNEKRKWEERIK